MSDRTTHWDNVYATKGEAEVSWYQDSPAISLEMIRAVSPDHRVGIIDIGGGAIVTASITNESVEELKLAKGQTAMALIKASDVLVAVD